MSWTLTRADTGETHSFAVRPTFEARAGGWQAGFLFFADPTGDTWTLTVPTTNVVDVPTFIMRFWPQEELDIRASEDALVKLFLKRLDDPRVKNVNLAHPSVQGAVMYMALNVDPPLIAAARPAEILAPERLA